MAKYYKIEEFNLKYKFFIFIFGGNKKFKVYLVAGVLVF